MSNKVTGGHPTVQYESNCASAEGCYICVLMCVRVYKYPSLPHTHTHTYVYISTHMYNTYSLYNYSLRDRLMFAVSLDMNVPASLGNLWGPSAKKNFANPEHLSSKHHFYARKKADVATHFLPPLLPHPPPGTHHHHCPLLYLLRSLRITFNYIYLTYI